MVRVLFTTPRNCARSFPLITWRHSLSTAVHLYFKNESIKYHQIVLMLNFLQGVTVNSLHPGIVQTDILHEFERCYHKFTKYIVFPLFKVWILVLLLFFNIISICPTPRNMLQNILYYSKAIDVVGGVQ